MLNRSLKILLVSSSSGSHGGGELWMVHVADALKTLGHNVHCVLSDHPRMNELADKLSSLSSVSRLPIVNTYDRRLRSLDIRIPAGLKPEFNQLIASYQPDVIHLNKQNLEDGLDLLRILCQHAVPLVSTVHVTRPMRFLGGAFARTRDWMAAKVLKRVRCTYVAVAEVCRKELVDFLGANSQREVHRIYNGVPVGAKLLDERRDELRRGWNAARGDFVLGTVARIEEQKHPLFAPSLLSRSPKNIRIVWVGDGRLRKEMEERAESLGVAGRLHVDGWREDAGLRMQAFDGFFLPSRYEGFPLAILEAMSYGLPCIASDVDGNREALGDAGISCPFDNLPAWEGAVNELIANQSLRAKLGKAALNRYEKNFSLDALGRNLVALYNHALSQHVPTH